MMHTEMILKGSIGSSQFSGKNILSNAVNCFGDVTNRMNLKPLLHLFVHETLEHGQEIFHEGGHVQQVHLFGADWVCILHASHAFFHCYRIAHHRHMTQRSSTGVTHAHKSSDRALIEVVNQNFHDEEVENVDVVDLVLVGVQFTGGEDEHATSLLVEAFEQYHGPENMA